MKRDTRHTVRGLTLVELAASVAVMTVVTGGIASAMFLASHAVPDGKSSNDAVLQGYNAAEQVVGELYCAQSFSLKTPTAVEFTVPDRDADSNPETIRYEWSGTPGDPLTRKYNTQSPMTIVEDVYEYQLDYNVRTVTETIIEQVEQTVSTELAYFVGWGGVTAASLNTYLVSTDWVSQHFTITPPPGATSLAVTQAQLMLHKDPSGISAAVTVGIHAAKSDGSYEPEPVPVGPTTTVPGSGLMGSYMWFPADFSGVTITDLSQTGYCLVVKGTSVIPVWLQHLYAKTAPANGTIQRWTTDSGASWDPQTNQLNQQDIVFRLDGTYTLEPVEQETTIDRDYLTSIDLTLRVGADSTAQVRTSSQVLNAPEVLGS